MCQCPGNGSCWLTKTLCSLAPSVLQTPCLAGKWDGAFSCSCYLPMVWPGYAPAAPAVGLVCLLCCSCAAWYCCSSAMMSASTHSCKLTHESLSSHLDPYTGVPASYSSHIVLKLLALLQPEAHRCTHKNWSRQAPPLLQIHTTRCYCCTAVNWGHDGLDM